MKKIILSALICIVMFAAPSSALTLFDPEGLKGNNLSELLDYDYVIDGAIIGGTEILYEDTPLRFTADSAISVNAAIEPEGSGLIINPAVRGIDMEATAEVFGKFATVQGTKPKEYTLTVTAENSSGQKQIKSYKFSIYPEPSIADTTPQAITWGKACTFTPSASNVSSWEIDSSGELDPKEYLFDLPDGLEFDDRTGNISGTWKAPDDINGLAFGEDKTELARKIRLRAYQDKSEKSVYHDYTLTFKAKAPVIQEKAKTLTADYFSNFMYDEYCEAVITAEGSGIINWKAENLPSGLELQSEDYDGLSSLIITGTPTALVKGKTITFTAYNSAGSVSVSPKITIGYTGDPEFTDDTLDNVPQGIYAVGMSITDKAIEYNFDDNGKAPKDVKAGDINNTGIFEVLPGPVSWKASGLPSGIKLIPDKDNNTARLEGNFTKAGTFTYTISAKNTLMNKSVSLKETITVYAKPEITIKKLPDLTAGKKYSTRLAAKNNPARWNVSFATGSALSYDVLGREAYNADDTSESEIQWNNDTRTIEGMLDSIPEGGIFSVRVEAENPAGSGVKIYTVNVKGVSPVISTKSLPSMKTEEGGTAEIAASGTMPVFLGAFIDAGTAKSFFGLDGKTSIDLTEEDNATGFLFTPGKDNDGTGTLALRANSGFAYKSLPITISAVNAAVSKPVTKSLKINVTGEAPKFYLVDDNEETEITDSTMNIVAGTSGTGDDTEAYTFRVRGSKPLAVTSSLKQNDRVSNTIEDKPEGYTDITIYAKPLGASKETKTTITLTASNSSTKAKTAKKINVITQLAPTITTKDKALVKEVESGKTFSLKLAAKGSSPLTWSVTDEKGEDADEILESYGLAFSGTTGTFSGTAGSPTFNNNGDYSPVKLLVTASNYAGKSEPVTVTLGIKGRKPKLSAKTLTFDRTNPDFESMKLTTDIEASDNTANVKYSTDDSKLATLGLKIAGSQNNEGILEQSGKLQATKGTSIKITADNYGNTVTGSVKFVITDPAPEIDAPTIPAIHAEEKKAVTEKLTLKLSEAPTGDSKLKWTVASKPYKGITASLKANSSGSEAVLTLTVPKKFTGSGSTTQTSIGITVTNQNAKTSSTTTIPFSVAAWNSGSNTDNTAHYDSTNSRAELPKPIVPDILPVISDEVKFGVEHDPLTLGAERTEASLTEDEIAAIEAGGFMIAAILPELSADEAGQYDLEVDIEEHIPAGTKMYWFAFPRDAEPEDDDNIIDFYDDKGIPTETVPESHIVIVSPWLRENVTYAPVIMVKP